MTDLWTLRDIDNRDDSGDPRETTGTAAELADYIEGPLLSDLTDPEDAGEEIKDVAARMRAGTWEGYDRRLLEYAGVYIRRAGQIAGVDQ